MEGSLRVRPVALVAVLTVGYAWWATSLRPFTSAALVAMFGGGLAAVVTGELVSRRIVRPPAPEPRGGTAVWMVLVFALVAWEVAAYLQVPRSEHPTLSSLANDVLRHHPLRALAMVAWLTLGITIARR